MDQWSGTDALLLRQLRGAKIRKLRIALGLKKSELGRRSGVSYSHIDNIEHGRRQPSIELLHRLALALRVDVDEIALTAEREWPAARTAAPDPTLSMTTEHPCVTNGTTRRGAPSSASPRVS